MFLGFGLTKNLLRKKTQMENQFYVISFTQYYALLKFYIYLIMFMHVLYSYETKLKHDIKFLITPKWIK